jgi:hypothetical protein
MQGLVQTTCRAKRHVMLHVSRCSPSSQPSDSSSKTSAVFTQGNSQT